MRTTTLILAALTPILMCATGWSAPRTPEQAWRQMQQDRSQRRSGFSNRSNFRAPQVNIPRVNQNATRSTTRPVTQPATTEQVAPKKAKPGKKRLSNLWGKLKGKFKRGDKAGADAAQSASDVQQPTNQGAGAKARKVAGKARERLGSIWQRFVGSINSALVQRSERRQAARAAEAQIWAAGANSPFKGKPIPAEVLVGGLRLHKLQSYNPSALYMLRKGGIINETEYQIIIQSRMGIPAGGMPQAEQPQSEQQQPVTPPPPQQTPPQAPPPGQN